jgi:AraC-like DNA-binding protein
MSVAPALAHLGIRWSEQAAVRSRSRKIRGTVAFSLESSRAADLIVDTPSSHPDHAAFLLVTTAEDELSSEETRSYVLQAPYGAAHRLRFRSRWTATGALIPRPPLEDFIQHLPDGSVVHKAPRLLERSMVAFITGILDATTPSSTVEEYAVAQLLTEMGAAVLLDRNGLPSSDARERVRRAASAFITHQSSDPDLAPIDVARHVRVSLRTLQAVFADNGTSPAAEIRRQRARSAHSLLTDTRYITLGIDQIAVRAGFRSTMSLRRALKERYGAAPRSLRRR